MKESGITDEVKRLAKEINKYWPMEVYEGCWVHMEQWSEKLFLITSVNGEDIEVSGFHWMSTREFIDGEDFPIPSISDCERKLLELGYESMNLLRRPFHKPWMVDVWDKESHDLDTNTIKRWANTGKTLHQALLSVLLEVLA